MPRNINLKPFKTITVALVACVMLFVDGIAWGTPYIMSVYIYAHIADIDVNIMVMVDIYEEDEESNDLKTFKGENPIFHAVFPGLPIPKIHTNLSLYELWFNENLPHLTVAHINSYWDQVYKQSDGWDRSSNNATTGYNCHGHSSGRNKWMAIQPTLNDDYDLYSLAYRICVGAIYGSSGHTGRISGTYTRTVGGQTEYAISQISEKFQASAVYYRQITNITYYPSGEIMPVTGSPFFGSNLLGFTIPNMPFYVPKP